MKFVYVLLASCLMIGCKVGEVEQYAYTVTQYAGDGHVINSWNTKQRPYVVDGYIRFEDRDGNPHFISGTINVQRRMVCESKE